jgi:hypothetical protein
MKLLAPATLDIYTPASVYHEQLRDSTDLIIYDFGGLLPGTSLMEDNSRRLIEWALDHPSCCIIVESTFTYNHYVKYEMIEKGLDSVHNICVNDFMLEEDNQPGFPVPQWFRDLHDLPYVDPYADRKAKKLIKPKGTTK